MPEGIGYGDGLGLSINLNSVRDAPASGDVLSGLSAMSSEEDQLDMGVEEELDLDEEGIDLSIVRSAPAQMSEKDRELVEMGVAYSEAAAPDNSVASSNQGRGPASTGLDLLI